MAAATVTSERGFTYIMVLVTIIIMGIMLGAAGQSWKTAMKREREKELLFRGIQIRNAIVRWNTPKTGAPVARKLDDLKQLLLDPNSLEKVRYLRRPYTDPITGKEWNIIRDPIKGIIGVASTSDEEPIKQANFPSDLKAFEGKKKYSEWQFVTGQLPSIPSSPTAPAPPVAPTLPGGTAQPIRYFEGL